ncbi:hypothetical protein GCM10009744_40480 [Kribbella alba]|uniref:ABC transporter domain-containing protein n=1 Tax=Kribbella alba TaxID=190197 RepID=A0ABN2FHT5_9ACTN
MASGRARETVPEKLARLHDSLRPNARGAGPAPLRTQGGGEFERERSRRDDLQKPTSGTVQYGGKDIFKLTRTEYDGYRRNVQPVFQDPYAIFNPFYRVDRLLWKAVKKFSLASGRATGLALIEESLRAVKLEPEHVLGRYPHQLSGGQRQRIM